MIIFKLVQPTVPLHQPCLQVCDVGGGTGFCTLGVVESVRPENVTLVDQSPHQLEKAKAKSALKMVTIKEVCISAISLYKVQSQLLSCLPQCVSLDWLCIYYLCWRWSTNNYRV